MFSASQDLSIVTWYPPRDDGNCVIRGRTAAISPARRRGAGQSDVPDTSRVDHRGQKFDPSGRHSSSSGRMPGSRGNPQSGSREERLPAQSPKKRMAQPEGGVDGAEVGGGVTANDGRTQANDPGFVMHLAGVVGLAVVPVGVISADSSGRVLVRVPDKVIGASPTTTRTATTRTAITPCRVGFRRD